MRVAIEVEGAKEFARAMRRAGDDLPQALREVHKKMVDIIVKDALPNVPVASGRLKSSVKALATQTKGSAKAGSKSVPYAPAVHWGTGPRAGLRGPHNIARRPFLMDALNKRRNQVTEEFEQAIDEIFERAMRSL